MKDATIIDQAGMEQVMYAIEESLKVCGRVNFYSWAQGALQGVLPHELLLCVCGDLSTFRFKYNSFSCIAEEQFIIEKLTNPVDGLLIDIIKTWLNSGRRPLYFAAGDEPADDLADDPTEEHTSAGAGAGAGLRRLGCGHTVAHGARDISSNEGSFFVFLQMPKAPKSQHGYLLDLVMPHLHMALYRMLLRESEAGAVAGAVEWAPESVLSAREIEVLRRVGQGKTNQEIGWMLDISPMTVKNHVHNILRKLGVNNRAQAVAKAHEAYLIDAEPNPPAQGIVTRSERAILARQYESE